MDNVVRFLIRTSAFVRKEAVEVLRQPRLVLALVLGPFLILLLFGIGYNVKAEPVRTMFVMDRGHPFRRYLNQYVDGITPLLRYAGLTDSLDVAKEQLELHNIDLVVVVPDQPLSELRNGKRPVFELYHNEIDPFKVDYIKAFARVYIDELNRRIVSDVAAEGQQQSSSLQETAALTQEAARQMRQALEAGNAAQANLNRQELDKRLTLLSTLLGGTSQVIAGVGQQFGADTTPVQNVLQQLASLQNQVDQLQNIPGDQQDLSGQIDQARQIETKFNSLEATLGELSQIPPSVLARPFGSEVKSISREQLRLSDFYVPASIALLAQHLGVIFAALSIVRERHGGTLEIFQVSPLSAIEALLGKYVSYLLLEILLLAVLTALSLWLIDVPMLGRWSNYALVLLTLIWTSLGVGFVISLIAESTSQAVQYAMLVLLASIFFSGFFLSLSLLRAGVRVVSWLLPATFATQMLQNVMLRGTFTADDQLLLLTLFGIGLAFFLLAWFLLRRRMARK